MFGRKPFHFLALSKKIQSIHQCGEILLKYRGSLDAVDKYGRTPLHYAGLSDNKHFLMLVEKNFNHLEQRYYLELEDISGRRPHHSAALKDSVEALSLFAKMRADFTARDKRSHSALHLAILKHHIRSIEFLSSSSSCLSTPDK